MNGGTHEQGATLGAYSSPYLGEGPTPRLRSQPPLCRRLAPPPRHPQPRLSSLSLLSFTSSLPLSLLPPDISSSQLPSGAAKFLRLRPRAELGPGRSCTPAALSPRTDLGPGPGPRNHAVRPLEELPPPPA